MAIRLAVRFEIAFRLFSPAAKRGRNVSKKSRRIAFPTYILAKSRLFAFWSFLHFESASAA